MKALHSLDLEHQQSVGRVNRGKVLVGDELNEQEGQICGSKMWLKGRRRRRC